MSSPEPDRWLEHLAALWRAEREAARAKFAEARRGATLATRVQRGVALADLAVVDVSPAPGDRLRVWLEAPAARRARRSAARPRRSGAAVGRAARRARRGPRRAGAARRRARPGRDRR